MEGWREMGCCSFIVDSINILATGTDDLMLLGEVTPMCICCFASESVRLVGLDMILLEVEVHISAHHIYRRFIKKLFKVGRVDEH